MTFPLRSLLVPAAFLGLAASASAAPALWQVSDGDSKIWLFGSIHMMPPDIKWRTPLFNQTLEDAKKVYFETDVSTEAQMEIMSIAFDRGFNVDGSLLSSRLDEAQIDAMRETAASVDLPMPALLTMKPWMAANTISVSAAIAAGFDQNQGVELVLQTELPAERQAYLETGEEQLEFLAGAPEEEQINMLVATIDEIDEAPALLRDMLVAWRTGTQDVLGDLFFVEMGAYDSAFLQRLVYDRNQNWMEPITGMLENNEQSMIVVGTGHLTGDGSVLDLLEDAGFTVERLQ